MSTDTEPAVAGHSEERYPIRIVSALTGVNAVTLRAWERRYGLVRPERTPTGHRLYSHDDIERLNRAVQMLRKGISISQVSLAIAQADRRSQASVRPDNVWSTYRQRMLSAVTRFSENSLDGTYQEILALYPAPVVIDKLIVPLMRELGVRWRSAEGSIAEEHFFGMYMRNKLGARFHHRSELNKGPILLSACLPGESHEIGLLLFALVAHDRGYRQVLLGANMPMGEVSLAAKRSGSDAIILAGRIDPPEGVLSDELPALCRSSGLPVFVGGHVSVRLQSRIVAAGAVPLGDDIDAGLQRVTVMLSAPGQPRSG